MATTTETSPTARLLRERAEPVIQEATKCLVEEFRPEQIWLFGSYAWGEPTEDSDLDLYVVVSKSDVSSLSRAQRAHQILGNLALPKDVIIKTREELDRVKALRPTLAYKIMHEGRLLYGS
ncbi:MAG: nucleotidyltransferase domain-containing protein [Verrucomicrobiales bacterium]|nr:nucleotidyltransferase domain-containing protein [Verrucomicrobiales bacterium]